MRTAANPVGVARFDSAPGPMSDTVECPTCGRTDFNSEQGMKAHHTRSHGESLTTVTVECEFCGEAVEKDRNKVENSEYNYCSQECVNEHKSERYSGDGNPRSTLVEVECANCGETLERPRWRRETRDRHLCDMDCLGEWRSQAQQGESNPRWSEYQTNECEYCGKAYKIKPSLADVQRFCSNECQRSWQQEEFGGPGDPRRKERVTLTCENCADEFQAEQWEAEERRYCSYDCMHADAHPTGEEHPRWNPNKTQRYYGPNWRRQRRRAILRDQARCQVEGCSNTEADVLQRYGKGITVHHLTPLVEFEGDDGVDHDAAHSLDNLITVCPECHRRVETGHIPTSTLKIE